jgi:hypothetical protein
MRILLVILCCIVFIKGRLRRGGEYEWRVREARWRR